MLWLKSRNSEVWLDRRTHYTRSCAVMSMVGAGDVNPLYNMRLDGLLPVLMVRAIIRWATCWAWAIGTPAT